MKDRNNIAIHAIADQFQTVIAKCVDKPQFTVLSSIASDSEAFKIVISAIVWGLRQFSLFRMYGSVEGYKSWQKPTSLVGSWHTLAPNYIDTGVMEFVRHHNQHNH